MARHDTCGYSCGITRHALTTAARSGTTPSAPVTSWAPRVTTLSSSGDATPPASSACTACSRP
jgi:hypothetical protein